MIDRWQEPGVPILEPPFFLTTSDNKKWKFTQCLVFIPALLRFFPMMSPSHARMQSWSGTKLFHIADISAFRNGFGNLDLSSESTPGPSQLQTTDYQPFSQPQTPNIPDSPSLVSSMHHWSLIVWQLFSRTIVNQSWSVVILSISVQDCELWTASSTESSILLILEYLRAAGSPSSRSESSELEDTYANTYHACLFLFSSTDLLHNPLHFTRLHYNPLVSTLIITHPLQVPVPNCPLSILWVTVPLRGSSIENPNCPCLYSISLIDWYHLVVL